MRRILLARSQSMSSKTRSILTRYGIGAIAIFATVFLKFLMVPLVSQDVPFLLFSLAVTVTAWIGGLGPGLFATALAAVLNQFFFLRPFLSMAYGDANQPLTQLLFTIEGVCISLICARMNAARQRAEDSANEARELERRILEVSDAEQRRIGHDLHDGLGQHLTGITLVSRRLQQRLVAAESPDAEEAAKLLDLSRTAVNWTRDLCRSLSPPVLEREGLAEALLELAANAEKLFGIRCTCDQTGADHFTDVATSVHLYRIAQEAISNAVKHGRAKNIAIQLLGVPSGLTMCITDDGKGFDQRAAGANGMGVRIMQYRAKMIGAQVDIQSASDGGAAVVCRYTAPQTSSHDTN